MKKGLIIGIIAVAACCAVAFGVHHEMRRTAQMRTALVALQAANQADSVFTTDSLALELVRFFDHPLHFWTSANDRLMAHYLLGRCYADMGEAPRAIGEYSEAVEQADTTASDCDLHTLRAVYGQMANVFHQQNLPHAEIEANRSYCNLSRLLGDSTGFILGYSNLIRPYYLLGDTNKVLDITHEAEQMSLSRADTMCAAWLNVAATYIYILRGQLTTAQQKIDYIREYSGIFDSQGNLRAGREMFYYTLGLFFENTHQLDSAEYYYRRLLLAHEYEAAYRGLLSVYEKREIADSIGKFARLYADANDAAHDKMSTQAVAQAAKSYQYTRQQQLAKSYEAKAKRRAYALCGFLVLILVLSYIIYKQRIKFHKKAIVLSYVREQYRQARNDYRKMCEDNSTMKKRMQAMDVHVAYYSSDIIRRVTDSVFKINDVSAKERNDLYALFLSTFNDFKSFADNRGGLTENEWEVCIYVDLGFHDKDISNLMGITVQRVYGLKKQLNRKLFHSNEVTTLARNLRQALHPSNEA